MMSDEQALIAQYAEKYGLTDEMIKHAERWTETDGDLAGLSEKRVRGILDLRFSAIAVDTPRSELWHTPDTIDVIEDLPYLPDGGYDTEAGQCRGHLLDLYLPHDAVLRAGHTTPVYIDIHGGGFTYGYKELNRNFNVHLADMGFAVFSLNYRPAPQTDLRGQLADVQAALRWIKAHLADYPVNPNAVFLTGDSAGGALTMLTLAIENSAELRPRSALTSLRASVSPARLRFAACTAWLPSRPPTKPAWALPHSPQTRESRSTKLLARNSSPTSKRLIRDSSPQKDSSTTLICRRCSLPPAATIFWRQIISALGHGPIAQECRFRTFRPENGPSRSIGARIRDRHAMADGQRGLPRAHP